MPFQPELVDTVWSIFGKVEVDQFALEESIHHTLPHLDAMMPSYTHCQLAVLYTFPALLLIWPVPQSPSGRFQASATGPVPAREELISSAAQNLSQCSVTPPRQKRCAVLTGGWGWGGGALLPRGTASQASESGSPLGGLVFRRHCVTKVFFQRPLLPVEGMCGSCGLYWD